MNTDDRKWIRDILFSGDLDSIIEEIKQIDEPLFLHVIAGNYNWGEGFKIPTEIISSPYCDLGTALLMFYDADGYKLLESREVFNLSVSASWKKFILYLYDKIAYKDFQYTSISFDPPIPKMRMYRIIKNNPDIPAVFFVKSPGIVLEMPRL